MKTDDPEVDVIVKYAHGGNADIVETRDFRVRDQFEKDLKNPDFPGYFVTDFSKDEKGNYNNGQIAQMWAIYLHGYSLGKSTHQ